MSSPYTLLLDVPTLSQTRIEYDYTVIPVDPSLPTSIDIRLFNLGNSDVGYDLFLEAPPGWHAGFDDLSSQGGANSASTGLMLKDGQMSIGITFTPPQVMTLAGAELTVVFKVVSQTEDSKMVEYELPLAVDEISLAVVDLETSFSSIIPGNSLSLQYTIENRGNIDLLLSPRMQLPNGWMQNTNLEDIDLSWTESRNIVISISAGQDAKSGEIKLIMDSGQDSWSHTEDVDVLVLAEPKLTFTSVEIAGETWSNIFGPGQHPAGVPINYTWVVENLADTDWNPSVSLQLENNLLGECSSPGQISRGEVKPMTCTIIISAMAEPSTEPEFKVTLSGDMVSTNETVTMLVALSKEVSWKIDGPEVLQTGETSTIQLTTTNIGNTIVSGTVVTTVTDGWDVEFDGADSVNLQAGQSQKIRLKVTANQPGEGEISISISGADEVDGSQIVLEMSSNGEVAGAEGESFLSEYWILLLIIPVILGAVAFIMLRNRDENSIPTNAPISTQFQLPVQHENTIPCFSCRQPILSMMVGCPSCGARYHSVCKVTKCINCDADSSNFVNVE